MTALTHDRANSDRLVKYIGLPLGAGLLAYKGAIACVDSMRAIVSPAMHPQTITSPYGFVTVLTPIGVFAEQVDNRAGSGTVKVQVELARELRLWWLANDGSVTAANLFARCFLLDDQTVSIWDTGVRGGRIWEVDPTRGVSIEMLPPVDDELNSI